MTDHATPNLPSRNFEATSRFYQAIGFVQGYRGDEWMIMERGSLMIEFFQHPKLKPKESWFSCCLRVDDLDALHAVCKATGLTDDCRAIPRLHPIEVEAWGSRSSAFVDPDGTLVRLIQN
jgi:catechol 2,3-dioxygenase-like lactoylglutathione lyase family enzyme